MIITQPTRYVIFFALSIIYYFGMQIDVMDVDAAQYANMAFTMLSKSNWLEFTNRGFEYLDKPPLLFWLSATSFELFGASNFTYKLPTILFSIVGIISTYKFSKLYYSENSAFISAVILASCQAYFLFNNDVRTDAILANSVIFAYYNLAAYLLQRKAINFIFAFMGISLALLSKGPIGIVTVIFGFGGHLFMQKNYQDIFNWRWILGLFVIAFFLAPMCYGLYTQFGTEGLRFYFWTQSFGRITGESIWENNMGPLYIFHSFLWGFLPWTILPFIGIYFKVKLLIESKFKINNSIEYITFFGIVLSYLSLEQSRYELPHYIFLVTPFAAILSGFAIEKLSEKNLKLFFKFQIPVLFALWVLGIVLFFYIFPFQFWHIILYLALFLVFVYLLIYNKSYYKIFYLSFFAIATINLFLNICFYPELMKYQPASHLRKVIEENHLENEKLFELGIQEYSNEFYLKHEPKSLSTIPLISDYPKGKSYYIICKNQIYYEFFQRWTYKTTRIASFPMYHVSLLKPKFLNPNTRKEVIDTLHFCRVDL